MAAAPSIETMTREHELVIPTHEDVDAIGRLQVNVSVRGQGPLCLGRANDFLPPCCCTVGQLNRTRRAYRMYAEHYPQKLSHCRIVRGASGEALGALQLTLPGDPGNMDQNPCSRHATLEGEAYVDWIACAPEAQGKGIGTKLLAWADEEAKAAGAQFLCLHVGGSNDRAANLYQRHGLEFKPDPHVKNPGCYGCLLPPILFCCFGGRYASLKYMEKRLVKSEGI